MRKLLLSDEQHALLVEILRRNVEEDFDTERGALLRICEAAPVVPRCSCTYEAGDSDCPAHLTDPETGEPIGDWSKKPPLDVLSPEATTMLDRALGEGPAPFIEAATAGWQELRLTGDTVIDPAGYRVAFKCALSVQLSKRENECARCLAPWDSCACVGGPRTADSMRGDGQVRSDWGERGEKDEQP